MNYKKIALGIACLTIFNHVEAVTVGDVVNAHNTYNQNYENAKSAVGQVADEGTYNAAYQAVQAAHRSHETLHRFYEQAHGTATIRTGVQRAGISRDAINKYGDQLKDLDAALLNARNAMQTKARAQATEGKGQVDELQRQLQRLRQENANCLDQLNRERQKTGQLERSQSASSSTQAQQLKDAQAAADKLRQRVQELSDRLSSSPKQEDIKRLQNELTQERERAAQMKALEGQLATLRSALTNSQVESKQCTDLLKGSPKVEEVTALQKQLTDAQAHNKKMQEENAAALKKCQDELKQAQERAAHVKNLEDQLGLLRNDLQKSHDATKKCSDQLSSRPTTSDLDRLRQQLTDVSTQAKAAHDAGAAKDDQIAALRAQMTKAQKDCETQLKDLAKKSEDNLATAQGNSKKCQEQLKAKDDQIADLQGQNKKMQDETKHYNDELKSRPTTADLDRVRTDASTQAKAAHDAGAAKDDQIAALRAQMTKAQRDCEAQLKDLTKKSEDNLATAQGNSKKCQEQLKAKDDQIADLEAQNKKMQDERDRLSKQLTDAGTQVKAARDAGAAKDDRIKTLTDQAATLRDQLAASQKASARVDYLERENAKLRKELEDTIERTTELERQAAIARDKIRGVPSTPKERRGPKKRSPLMEQLEEYRAENERHYANLDRPDFTEDNINDGLKFVKKFQNFIGHTPQLNTNMAVDDLARMQHNYEEANKSKTSSKVLILLREIPPYIDQFESKLELKE